MEHKNDLFGTNIDASGLEDSRKLLLGISSSDLGFLLRYNWLREHYQPDISYINLGLVADYM